MEIDARWSPSGEPNFELTDDEKLVPRLWRGDLSLPDELIDLKVSWIASMASRDGSRTTCSSA